MKAGTCEEWEILLEDYFNGSSLGFKFQTNIDKFILKKKKFYAQKLWDYKMFIQKLN